MHSSTTKCVRAYIACNQTSTIPRAGTGAVIGRESERSSDESAAFIQLGCTCCHACIVYIAVPQEQDTGWGWGEREREGGRRRRARGALLAPLPFPSLSLLFIPNLLLVPLPSPSLLSLPHSHQRLSLVSSRRPLHPAHLFSGLRTSLERAGGCLPVRVPSCSQFSDSAVRLHMNRDRGMQAVLRLTADGSQEGGRERSGWGLAATPSEPRMIETELHTHGKECMQRKETRTKHW